MCEYINIFVIFGFLSLLCPVTGQITYTIGVQDVYAAEANVMPKLAPNIAISIVNVTIQDCNNVAALRAEITRLSALGLDFLIYIYNQTAVLATNNMPGNKIVPYLVLPPIISDPILSRNMMYIKYQVQMAIDATVALLTRLNATNIVYIDYGFAPTESNLIQFEPFAFTKTVITSNFSWPDALIDIFKSNNQNFYVCAVPLSDAKMIENLLTEAMLKGQLNPGKVWIFIDVTSDNKIFAPFQPFASVGATIYGFWIYFPENVPISNLTVLTKNVARDYVRLISIAINSTPTTKITDTTQQLLKAVLAVGDLVINAGFNDTTRIANGTTVNVMKINASPAPLPVFTYNGTLLEHNIHNLTLKLNDSRVTVRIGVVMSQGYFMQNSKNEYYGFSLAMLRELLKLSNFKYVFVFPGDGLTGEVVTQNGSAIVYSGIISHMNRSLVDMSIIPMLPNYIQDVTYQSDKVLTYSINFLTRPVNETINFTLIFTPFTYNVWIAIVGSILIMTLAFYVINKISPNTSKDGNKTETYSFFYSLLIMYSSFVTAKLKIKPNKPSLHIFAFILWFSTLTLVITYASNMVPFLVKSNSSYPFSTIMNLFPNATPTGFKWGFINNSVDLPLIQSNPALSILYNFALTNWPSQMFINDTASHLALVTDKFIIIQNNNKNYYLLNRVCNTSVVLAQTYQLPLILPMRTNWAQRVEMKSLIAQLINSGTINTIQSTYFNLGPCAADLRGLVPTPQTLTLLGTAGLFMLPLIGVVFGATAVICQKIGTKIARCRENMKLEKFKYGEIYNGKINNIERDGIWAIVNGRTRPYFISSTNLHSDLRKKYSPEELGLEAGQMISLKYFGKDPVNNYKRFCKLEYENY